MKTELIQIDNSQFQLKLHGKLDIERINFLLNIFRSQYSNTRFYVSFKELSFVGSNGILYFFSSLNGLFKSHRTLFEIRDLNNDFKRILKFENYPYLVFPDLIDYSKEDEATTN